MIIEDEFSVSCSRDVLIAFLLDTDRVSQCLPGLEELVETGPDTYEATLAVSVGPIKSRFAGDLQLNRAGAPDYLTAKAKGRDRQTGSVAKIDVDAKLSELSSEVTNVTFQADVTLRGRLGQFGTGVIKATAAEMMKDFASCVEARLGTRGPGEGGPASHPVDAPASAKRPSVLKFVLRGLGRYLLDGARQAVAAIGRTLGRWRSR